MFSVADPECLSRILIFYLSRIPDLTTATRGGGKILVSYLLLKPQIPKIKKYFIFEHVQKKN
jgi:hypothetical protein